MATEMLCGICGEPHNYLQCNFVEIKSHIPDSAILTKAWMTLPKVVGVETMADGTRSAKALAFIEKGTKFGPLDAQKLLTANPTITFPIKLFSSDVVDFSEYYLDTSEEHTSNWMMFVTPAQNTEEQNLICFQEQCKIFYVATKDIESGKFLKVWYSPYYAKKMNTKVLTSENFSEVQENFLRPAEPIDLNSLLKKQQNLAERNNWTCKFCSKLETDVSKFATHMLEHYNSRINHKYCNICKQSFTSQKKLRSHKATVHKNIERDLSKNLALVEVPQDNAKNKDMLVGGPLLNDLLNDSFDNTNLAMPSLDLDHFEIPIENTLENLENDSLSLNTYLLTENVKELDHFNFEIGESQEQYVCDVCLKVFFKLPYLMQHLKKHTGKFTCSYCLKIFCRRENLVAHRCKNENAARFSCNLCQSEFTLKKYFVRHMKAKHDKKYGCENCNKKYYSAKEYKEHNCSAIPDSCKQTFTCSICSKKFFREIYLKRHMQTHEQKGKVIKPKKFICEICAERFVSIKGLRLHKKSHYEPTLACATCRRKFYRQDVLDNHVKAIHTIEPKVKCKVCDKDFKSKSNLSAHMLHHSEERPHKCDTCSKTFYSRSSLINHVNKTHVRQCRLCNTHFSSKESFEKHKATHISTDYFECPLCSRIIKLRSSLRRHLKQSHPGCNPKEIMDNIKPTKMNRSNTTFLSENVMNNGLENENNNELIEKSDCINNICNEINANVPATSDVIVENENDSLENIVNSFEKIINDCNANDLPPADYDSVTQSNVNQGRMLDFSDLQIDIDSNFDLQTTLNADVHNREVCLSMPDLTEGDQEITLGENAYMLEDGTIVEPKEEGNILVYILSK